MLRARKWYARIATHTRTHIHKLLGMCDVVCCAKIINQIHAINSMTLAFVSTYFLRRSTVIKCVLWLRFRFARRSSLNAIHVGVGVAIYVSFIDSQSIGCISILICTDFVRIELDALPYGMWNDVLIYAHDECYWYRKPGLACRRVNGIAKMSFHFVRSTNSANEQRSLVVASPMKQAKSSSKDWNDNKN